MAGGQFGGGDGSIYNPLIVEDALDFIQMGELVRKNPTYYVLRSDIDLDAYIVKNGWAGITMSCGYYSKVINGAGHKIKFTETRSAPLFTLINSAVQASVTINDLFIQTNSDTESENILVGLGGNTIDSTKTFIFNRCRIDLDYNNYITKGLFLYSVDLNNCKINISNDPSVFALFPTETLISFIGYAGAYRTVVEYDLTINDNNRKMTIGEYEEFRLTGVGTWNQCIVTGNINLRIRDVTGYVSGTYAYENNLDIEPFYSAVNCYSDINIYAYYVIGYSGTDDYTDDDVLVSTVLDFEMSYCSHCYFNGTLDLTQKHRVHGLQYGGVDMMITDHSGQEAYLNIDKASKAYIGSNHASKCLTDEQMKTKESFKSFSFAEIKELSSNSIWGIAEGVNNGYPFLWWFELAHRLKLEVQNTNKVTNIPIKRLGFDLTYLIFGIGVGKRGLHLVEPTDSTALNIYIQTPSGKKALSSSNFNYYFDLMG